MSYEFDYLVFAGRFAPFTLAHRHVVEQAMERARKVVMLVGSAFSAPVLRTPWSFDERALMIRLGVSDEHVRRLEILPLADYDRDEDWVARVHQLVNVFAQPHDKIGLIGHAKDHTSYYLRLFPEWGSVDVENFEGIDATKVRKAYFGDRTGEIPFVAPVVKTFLEQWGKTDAYWRFLYEHRAVEAYREKYGPGPFLTADALVESGDKVLLIQRTKDPGRDLWALPGGFMNPGETFLQCALRELREETNFPTQLLGAPAHSDVFDSSVRDPRAHIVSRCFAWRINRSDVDGSLLVRNVDDGKLEFAVRAADDAGDARWFRRDRITRGMMYADHFHVIERMLRD